MITIRKPKVDETSAQQEQCKQIRKYLFGLADELEYALSKIENDIKNLQKGDKNNGNI